jgi:phospholipid-binding lipoprotein MlaA
MEHLSNKYLASKHFTMRRLIVALSISLAAGSALAAEPVFELAPDDAMQIELPTTLINAVPTNDSFTSSVQPTSEQEDDPAMTAIDDPWEGFNRSIYSFNLKADKYVLKPVATTYDKITPEPVKHGVRNFFSNLKSPTVSINELLQGRPMDSTKTLGRFAVNTTAGVLGLFDPASSLGLERRNEDFGQTLAVWGWDNSNYLVLPLLGPNSMRDFVGFIGDSPINPMNYADGGTSAALQTVEITDMRTQFFPLDDMRANAIDEYMMIRDAWAQSRNKDIEEGTQPQVNASAGFIQRLFQ